MRLPTLIAVGAVLSLLLPAVASAQTYYYNPGSSYYPSSYNYGYQYYYPYNYGNTYPYYQYGYYQQRPTCSITYQYINNAYWDSRGLHQPIQLSWSSNYAYSGYISGIGNVSSLNGQQVVYPNGSTTYTMTVWGWGGSNTCQVTYTQPYYWQQYNPYQYGYQYQYGYPYQYQPYYTNQYYPQYYSYPYNYQYQNSYPYYYGY